MADKEIRISVSEYTIATGKKKSIRVNVDGKIVQIPVDEDVYAYFKEQFLRDKPSAKQKQKFATLMNIVRQAYLKGLEDGNK